MFEKLESNDKAANKFLKLLRNHPESILDEILKH